VDACTSVVDQDFFWSGARSSDTKTRCVSGCMSESVTAACEVCCASAEVERAFDATHSAIALRRPATAGESDSRVCCHELQDMQTSMRSQFAQQVRSVNSGHELALSL